MNAQISHSTELMEIDLEIDFSTIRMETGETLETFFLLHWLKGDTFHKIIHSASQELISLTILFSANLIIDLRVVLHLTSKHSRKTITRRLLMRFALQQPTISLMVYETFVL